MLPKIVYRQPRHPLVSRLRPAAWLLVAAIAGCAAPQEDVGAAIAGGDTDATNARAAITEYAAKLKSELQAALARGPIAAVDVCHTRAGRIAAEVGALHEVTIGRTALKVRNPDNRPGDWERKTLEEFSRALAAGEAPGTLSAQTVVGGDGGREHVYMQPIMTAPLCLVCHGAAIDPELAGHIAGLYPGDQARGFAAGDLRGAFVVRRPAQ